MSAVGDPDLLEMLLEHRERSGAATEEEEKPGFRASAEEPAGDLLTMKDERAVTSPFAGFTPLIFKERERRPVTTWRGGEGVVLLLIGARFDMLAHLLSVSLITES